VSINAAVKIAFTHRDQRPGCDFHHLFLLGDLAARNYDVEYRDNTVLRPFCRLARSNLAVA